VATTFAARDAIANASSFESFEWLPLVESLINDLVFAGIAIWFLLSIADRVVRGDLIRRHALVLDTVSEIENLTTGMSRKIWQKISLLQATDRTHRPPS